MRLYGFFTQNSRKPLYVLCELGVDFEFEFVDLSTGVQRSEEFLAKSPVGKVPVLEHDGKFLFESGAICRYAANVTGSELYPNDPLQRAYVDQWLDFFVCHLGRWTTKLYFEIVIKPKFDLGPVDEDSLEEARKFAKEQFKLVNEVLEDSDWLANDALSIADLAAFAYVEQCADVDYDLGPYPNVIDWMNRIESRGSIAKARKIIPS